MVHDNPLLEVWRSLPLYQTELNIFCKWSRLNQIGKMILTPLIDIDNLKIELLWSLMTKGEKLHKDGEKIKDDKGGEV